ncbi:biotin/lipoyl-containing protein [Gemmatimonadota bacterium]
MFTNNVKALIEHDSENPEQIVLLAPAVGLFRPHLPKGAYVTPDLKMGTFNQLQQFSDLVVPQGARGAVLEQLVADGVNKVQYRTPLLRIGTATAEQMAAAAHEEENLGGTSSSGDIAVRSPTDGIFYRKPDPESLPYVAVGDVIEPGAKLGLVEVMKCFNQIRLEGDTLPGQCEVIQIPVEDGCEVKLGQVLFVLKES